MLIEENVDMILTVVRKGWAEVALKAAIDAGAQGSTIFHGRGTSTHDWMIFMGMLIEPEKEMVLTVVPRERSKDILIRISEAAELEKPGNGISVVWPLSMAVGRIVDPKSLEKSKDPD